MPGEGGDDSDLLAFPVGINPNCAALAKSSSQLCNTPFSIRCCFFTGNVSPSNLRDPSPRWRKGSSVSVIYLLAIFCPILSFRKLDPLATLAPFTALAK